MAPSSAAVLDALRGVRDPDLHKDIVTLGFVKNVREKKYDEVLGVHIIGTHATDLIAEACTALSLETTAEDVSSFLSSFQSGVARGRADAGTDDAPTGQEDL